MGVTGVAEVECPGCGRTQAVTLVQSINTRTDAAVKQQLLAGELNVLACACGRTTQLAASMLFHDPDADYYVRVVPDESKLAEAASLFRASGATGKQRLVPTPNALVEKVKILDAGLEDWAIELLKVLLLATVGDLERVFLFDRIDRDAGLIHWVLFDEGARTARTLESPIAGYDRLIATAKPPRADERQIDRAWAVTAAQALIAGAN
jgi:CpXC motif protein